MENAMSRRKRILLTGTVNMNCWGCHICLPVWDMPWCDRRCHLPGHMTGLVALSAEPLAGWGRHLQGIRMLHAASPVPMVVLVPSRLQEMRLLRGTAQVISGRDSLLRLRDMLRQALKEVPGRKAQVN